MKTAAPTDFNKKDLCASFGRAPYFTFGENGSVEVVENPASQAEGGAGIKAAQFVADAGAEAVVAVRCGQNAADALKAAGVKIYEAVGTDAKENIAALEAGELTESARFRSDPRGSK